jgi:hypothetical protein
MSARSNNGLNFFIVPAQLRISESLNSPDVLTPLDALSLVFVGVGGALTSGL